MLTETKYKQDCNNSGVAGGMENMSRVPDYMPRANQHPPFDEIKIEDGLIKDGLWDVYN